MVAQTGELLTLPNLTFGDSNSGGIIQTIPEKDSGEQDNQGFPLMAGLAGSGENPIPKYSLACYDDTNTRHFWVDTSISLTNAPDGFTYVEATLVSLGKF